MESTATTSDEQDEALALLRSGRSAFLTGPAGCVDGNAMVTFIRGGISRKISLRDLFVRFHGGRTPGQAKVWCRDTPTFTKSLVDGLLRVHRIEDVLDRGIRPVVRLALASGKSIRVTPDHEVCIAPEVFVRADALVVGGAVLTNGTPSCEHRLVVEADMNGVSPKEDRVVSVVPDGEAHVYDIVCDDPWRNFVANGIVIHNCGKSYLVRRFLEACEADGTQVLVTATTGVAAMLLGGQTLHSAVGLPVLHDSSASSGDEGCGWASHAARTPRGTCGAFLRHRHESSQGWDAEDDPSPTVKALWRARARKFHAERLRAAHVLILDEVSMCDARTLDHASWLLAALRQVDAPFGGLQVLLVGDLAQLPPVEGDRWGWAPDSAAWRGLRPETIALTQVRRQTDPEFTGLLGRLRFGRLAPPDARALLGRVGAFDPRSATRILPTNRECDGVNGRELASVPGQLRVSEARDEVWCPDCRSLHVGGKDYDHQSKLAFLLKRFDEGCPSPRTLHVKVGARVLITVNDDAAVQMPSGRYEKLGRYANGTAGTLTEIGVPCPDDERPLHRSSPATERERLALRSLHDVAAGDAQPLGVLVKLDSGRVVWLGRHTWTVEERGQVVAARQQFPLRLGWAITAHRAQGCTLARASVSLERCFTEGQAYVALSRVKSLDGLNLESARLGLVAAHPRFIQFEQRS